MANAREKATGIIKKVFPRKTEPFGFLKLLTPLEVRGEEAVFYLKDVLVGSSEKTLLNYGMQMECYVREKPEDSMQSYVPFRAEELKPLDPAYYTASVIKSADPRPGGKGLLVCLDVSLVRVSITTESYEALQLNSPLLPGDTCRVRISWQEVVQAALNSRTPTGEIAEVLSKNPNLAGKRSLSLEELSEETTHTPSPRTSETPEESSETTNDNASDDETSCENDTEPRARRIKTPASVMTRLRCRSVGDRPRRDAPPFSLGMCGSSQNYIHAYPHMPYPSFMHPEELQFNPAIQASQFHSRSEHGRCYSAMNECHPSMMASAYQQSAINSAQWLPQSCPAPRKTKMTLREYLERGGKIF